MLASRAVGNRNMTGQAIEDADAIKYASTPPGYIVRNRRVNDLYRNPAVMNAPARLIAEVEIKNDRTILYNEGAFVENPARVYRIVSRDGAVLHKCICCRSVMYPPRGYRSCSPSPIISDYTSDNS